METNNYRKKLDSNRKYFRDKEVIIVRPKKRCDNDDEIILGIRLVFNRMLFGMCYEKIFSAYFDSMPANSGVLIGTFIDTEKILKGETYPGDIDLLIIPYEGDELILSKTVAVELKVIRASFKKQGKSPNQYGFSQAQALLDIGFPYVAVGHLIISDESPKESWKDVLQTTILNSDTGECGPLEKIKADLMPANLIDRSYYRLKANRKNINIGFFSAYLADTGIFLPMGEKVSWNDKTNTRVLDSIWDYYQKNSGLFFDTKRYDP